MLRTTSLTVGWLILFATHVCTAQDPTEVTFKNQTARAARTAYESAIAKAKADYVAQLEIAIKEAGSEGDLDEANRIAEEKDAVVAAEDESDPIERARKKLEGTRWGPNKNQTLKLYPKRKVVFAGGYSGTWILSDPHTLLLQSSKTSNINVWKFDDKLKSAEVFMFSRFNKDKEVVYNKY